MRKKLREEKKKKIYNQEKSAMKISNSGYGSFL